MLFAGLFGALYREFRARRRRECTRAQFPFYPNISGRLCPCEPMRSSTKFLRTDVAAPVGRDTFQWMLVNGFTTWLFDGLDELYAGDPDFFLGITDVLTSPSSKAQILVCARDSLLSTCDSFIEFLSDFPPGLARAVRVYHLCEWKSPE